jgi:hypothetical protein
MKLIVKANDSDTSKAVALRASVVDDLDEYSDNDLRAIVTNWIDIEDDDDIMEVEIEEAIEELENENDMGVISAGELSGPALDDMQNLLVLLQTISECWIDSRLDFGDSDSRDSHPDSRLHQHCIASFHLLRLQQQK